MQELSRYLTHDKDTAMWQSASACDFFPLFVVVRRYHVFTPWRHDRGETVAAELPRVYGSK